MGEDPKLLPMEKISDDQIHEQVQVRLKLLGKMAGSLYPSIVLDEVSALRERLRQLKR